MKWQVSLLRYERKGMVSLNSLFRIKIVKIQILKIPQQVSLKELTAVPSHLSTNSCVSASVSSQKSC